MVLHTASGLTQPTQAGVCEASEALIPIAFQFKDSDAQSSWVYKSLRPALVVGQRRLYPKNSDLVDGAVHLRFCAPLATLGDRFTLTVGPRNINLASRPITKEPGGASRMTDIALLDQTRPDWVVVKGLERLTSAQGGLPSFDIELFNFGPMHPGGRVQYQSGSYGWSCAVNQPGSRVTVQISLSGQRLRVASSDPEYPEELVERSAEVRSGYCGGNFDVTADFGPTGRIPPGPTRIRYVLKSTGVIASSRRNSNTLLGGALSVPDLRAAGGYFTTPSYQIQVTGEGIW